MISSVHVHFRHLLLKALDNAHEERFIHAQAERVQVKYKYTVTLIYRSATLEYTSYYTISCTIIFLSLA